MYSTSSKQGFSHDNERQATLLLKNRSSSYSHACPFILKGKFYGKQNINAATFEVQKKIVSSSKNAASFLLLCGKGVFFSFNCL